MLREWLKGLLLGLYNVSHEGRPSQTQFQFAGATVDITPTLPVALAGYAGRSGLPRRVHSHLEANAALVQCGQSRILFLCMDLLVCGPHVVREVLRRAAGHGLVGSEVVITASHTHFAPATDPGKPLLGAVDSTYVTTLVGRLMSLIDTVLTAPLAPVSLQLGGRSANLSIGRRVRWPWPIVTRSGIRVGPNVVMGPSPDAQVDSEIAALRIVDQAGNLAGIIWKFACHPVAFPELSAVSSEYPGSARKVVRHHIGRRIPVIFLQGAAGDVRPHIGCDQSWRSLLTRMRQGPSFERVEMSRWEKWAQDVAMVLASVLRDSGAIAVEGPLSSALARVPLTNVLNVQSALEPHDRALILQLVRFGSTLDMVFASAEVCSPYLARWRSDRTSIVAGYSGDVFGYLPSEAQALEGGYEGEGFFPYFGLNGGWKPGFEQRISDALQSLRAMLEP